MFSRTILTFLETVALTSKEHFFYSRDFSEGNLILFKETLLEFDWQNVTNSATTQSSYDAFSSSFLDLYNCHFPSTKKKVNKNIHKVEKWYTSGLLISRRTKIQLGKDFLASPSQAARLLYTSYRNLYNKLVKLSKKKYFESELAKNQNNLRSTWAILRKATRRDSNTRSQISSIIVANQTFTEEKDIANNFNVFFTSVAEGICADIHPTVRPPEFVGQPDTPVFNLADFPITEAEILNVTMDLQSKKSEDLDGLSTNFVKQIISLILAPLSFVFNLSISLGQIPTQIKTAKVIPVFKSGDPLCMDNYRPISLLSVFSKILEKIVCNRLTSFLETNNLINSNQFGFRKKHSTFHPIIHLLNNVTTASNSNKYSTAIFCDLHKAFDTVDKEILLKKTPKGWNKKH